MEATAQTAPTCDLPANGSINFCFWNVGGKCNFEAIKAIVRESDCSVLLLAELKQQDRSSLLEVLGSYRPFVCVSNDDDVVDILTVLPSDSFIKRHTDNLSTRMSVWTIWQGSRRGLILGATHFHSKLHRSDIEQALIATTLAKNIAKVEEYLGFYNTLLVGDFNMNPFEAGIVSAHALNSVMCGVTARRGQRKSAGELFRYFYNPMWRLYSSGDGRPHGTYYSDCSREIEYYWNIFDQVLIRPQLLDRFEGLRVIDAADGVSLLDSKGRPDKYRFSDHLPIAFTITGGKDVY